MNGAVLREISDYFSAWSERFPPPEPRKPLDISTFESFMAEAEARMPDPIGRWRDAPDCNVFDVLGVRTNEVQNCRVLAWLLRPTAPHGLGPRVLMGLARRLGLELPPSASAGAFSVWTERTTQDGRVDIEVAGPDFLILVEAKVASVEHSDQLSRYRAWLHATGTTLSVRKEARHLIYLSRANDGLDPRKAAGDPTYLRLSWGQVRQELLEIHDESAASNEAQVALRNMLDTYCRHLGRHVVRGGEDE